MHKSGAGHGWPYAAEHMDVLERRWHRNYGPENYPLT